MDDYIQQQEWWMNNPELAAIDNEIEDGIWPDWTVDVIQSYDFQAAYPSPVVPLWNLERPLDLLALFRLVESRKARLLRLEELGAPTIILRDAKRILFKGMAEAYWKLSQSMERDEEVN